MDSPVISEAAFAARVRLSEAQHDLRVALKIGHLHEVMAAMHGFRTLAAMQAQEARTLEEPWNTTCIVLDQRLGRMRCAALAPDAPAEMVVKGLVEALIDRSSSRLGFVDEMSHQSAALHHVARSHVIDDPRLAGNHFHRSVESYDDLLARLPSLSDAAASNAEGAGAASDGSAVGGRMPASPARASIAWITPIESESDDIFEFEAHGEYAVSEDTFGRVSVGMRYKRTDAGSNAYVGDIDVRFYPGEWIEDLQ